MLYEELSGTIIGAAMEGRQLPGSGFLESVYERAPALELTGRQIPFERQAPIAVMHKQAQVGEYRADFLVDGKINPEVKATAALSAEHHAQALPYRHGTTAGAAPQIRRQVAPFQTHHPPGFLNPWNPWRFCF